MTALPQKLPPIGTLTDRVLLKRREQIDGGQDILVPVGSMWARVRSTVGAEATHSVVVRYRSDINPGDQFIYRGRPLEVVKCADFNGRRAYLVAATMELEP